MGKLTKRYIDSLKPPKSGSAVYWDDEVKGYGIRVWASSKKSYFVQYRNQYGRQRKMSLGRHGVLTPREARKRAIKILGDIAADKDPMGDRKKKRGGPTFKDLANEYIKRHASQKKSGSEDVRIINKDLMKAWGHLPVSQINRRDVISLINSIKDRGAPVSANRTLALTRKIFNFGIDQAITDMNPCARLKPIVKEQQRDRMLTEDEISAFWIKLPETDTSIFLQFALKMILITAQRPGEVISAEWQEFDLKTRWWTIPAEKTKNGLTQRVYLSNLAREILANLNNDGRFLFPSPQDASRHIKVNALSHGLRRNRDTIGIPHFTAHDLRRAAASHIASMGVPWVTISKILNHKISGPTSIYVLHSYDKEKKSALQAWSDKLEQIICDRRGNIIPLHK